MVQEPEFYLPWILQVCVLTGFRGILQVSPKLILILVYDFRMEFAYRTWVREIREGLSPDDLDELRREVQTALGTAKWQVGY